MQSTTHEHTPLNPKRRRRLFVWIGRAIMLIVLLFVFTLGMVHMPPVQKWGIKKLTTSIGGKLGTTVTLKGFNFNPISDLTLKEIFIGSPDNPSDTLLYANRLVVDYKYIWDLLNNRFTVNQIGINEGTLNIHRLPGSQLTNLDIALSRMMPPRDTTKAGFVFALDMINASKLNVILNDEYNGGLITIYLNRADVGLDTLDIANSYMDIREIDLDEMFINVTNRVVTRDSMIVPSASGKTWSFDVEHFQLTNGRVKTNNMAKPEMQYKDPRAIDYAHMDIVDLDMEMEDLVIRGWDFAGKNIDIHAQHANGFEIKKLAADVATVAADGIDIEKLRIITPESAINNSISLGFSGFSDFKTFTDSVLIDIPQADIILYVSDMLALTPGLNSVSFFSTNKDKNITLQGKVYGTVNDLEIGGLNASVGRIRMVGEFDSRNLAVKGRQYIDLNLRHSTFSAASLRDLFPGMKIPKEFDRAGQMSFAGKFKGNPNDFHLFGTFNTDLGKATLDINLNTLQGVSRGVYSGVIGLENFDLGALTGNRDLGRVTMTGRVIEGRGLSSTNMFADITGQLQSLTYKGYTYRNARLDGQFTGKLFNGTMDINDPNVDMHFEGIADFRDSLVNLDFIARVDSINFMALGFSKKPVSLKGYFDIDMTGKKLFEMDGHLLAENLELSMNERQFFLDSVMLIVQVDTISQGRMYMLESDVMSGMVRGTFNPTTLPGQVQQYLHERYPSTIDPPSKPVVRTDPQRMHWDITIHNSQNWFDLAGVEGLVIENGKTSGSLDLGAKHIVGELDLPELHYVGYNVYGSLLNFEETDGTTSAELTVIAADVNESFFFEEVLLSGTATDDSVRFRFKTDDLADVIDEIDMEVAADPEDGTWNITMNPTKLKMLGSDWLIPAGNKIEIRKDYFSLENFQLVSGDQRIVVEDINNKGIEAHIEGFDIAYLNTLWINDKFEFAGKYSLDLEIDNLYDIQYLKSMIHVPEMKVNNVPYGNWVFNASMNDPQDSVRISIDMSHNETKLRGEGAYLPPIKAIPKDKQNYLRLAIATTDFPLDFLEFLLGENIRDTEGSVDMNLSLTGFANQLVPNGIGKVYNGSTTIDYLGVAYSFHDQTFRITETMIDLSGTKLYDVLGNVATVEGGLTHRYLRDLGLAATMSSDEILGLDVTSEENSSFYGRGIGSVFARFTGTVANPSMHIQMTTKRGTHIYIPLSGSAESGEKDFVVFLENGLLPASSTIPINLGGINLTINMTITPDAIVEIIFDENTGDVLRGIGEGNIQLAMSRAGEFSMYGTYNIERGDYLFTNFRVVRKPFEILEGSSIRWDGDPYNANLNVVAKYSGLTASVYPLIEESLVGSSNDGFAQLRQDAKARTEVDLTMTLTGLLLTPTIKFDIEFPNLTGELKGLVDSKLSALRANETAMVEQVLFLMLMGSFLPAGAESSGLVTRGIDNTVGELLSATLSSLLGGLLGDLVPEKGALTGIDFQVRLELPITSGGDTGTDPEDYTATNVEVSLPLEFFNDRLSVNVGGNYVTGASLVAQSTYFAGDVTFEYSITPDRRLKIRAYNRNTLTIEGRKNKIGVGLAYRREYDSLGEIFRKKKNKDQGPKTEDNIETNEQ